MENVYITSYESASGDDGPNQQLSLNPEQIAWAYYKQASTGSYPAQPTNTFGWNTATNTPFTFSF
jgi:type VI protein secretion system component Hcp